MKKEKAFTLIELMVVVAVAAILSGVVMFSAVQYINKGKDSNIKGNLITLIPAGEVWYNANGSSYEGFCSPAANSLMKNIISQLPQNSNGSCYSDDNVAGLCCGGNAPYYTSWAACANEFANAEKAFCVDSRGVRQEIDVSQCAAGIIQCGE